MAYTPTNWVNDSAPDIDAPNLNKIEAGIAAAAAVVDSLLFNVKNSAYAGGAKGNNSTSDDDLAAIQAAIDACSTAGGGVVFVPKGTYYISGRLDVKANVTLQGAGINVTIIKSLTAATNPSVRMRGDNDVTIQDLTVDVNNRTNALGIVVECVSTATVATRHTLRRVGVKNSTNNAVRAQLNLTLDFTVEDCLFEDCEDGATMYGIAGQQHINPRFKNNRFRRIGTAVGGEFSHCVQLFSGSTPPVKEFVGVEITDNDMRDFTTPSTAIPIECNHFDGAVISRNRILTVATRGLGVGDGYNLTMCENIIKAQTIYAMELGDIHGFVISDNTVEGCASFFWETGSTGMQDGEISDNIYRGSGLGSAPVGGNAMKTVLAKRVSIVNNEFYDWEYLREAIRIGEGSTSEDILVEDNKFYINDANTSITAVNLCKTIRSSAKNNKIRVIRNLAAGDDYLGSICLHNNTASADLLVEGNETIFEGTVSAATNAAGIAHNGNISAFALTGVRVRWNDVIRGPRGVRLVINSADMIVERNHTGTCSNPDVIPATALRADEHNPQWFPTYRAASYYFCNSPASAGTSNTLGNGNFRGSPWVVTKPITITRIGAEFTAAGDAASIFRIGIYADNGDGIPTGAAVLDAGSISTGTGNAGTVATGGTPGVYEITVSTTLQPGVYWVGGAVQGVTVTQPTMRTTSASSHVAPVPSTAIPGTNAAVIGWTLTGQTGALGTWSGTSGSGSAVRIFFKTT